MKFHSSRLGVGVWKTIRLRGKGAPHDDKRAQETVAVARWSRLAQMRSAREVRAHWWQEVGSGVCEPRPPQVAGAWNVECEAPFRPSRLLPTRPPPVAGGFPRAPSPPAPAALPAAVVAEAAPPAAQTLCEASLSASHRPLPRITT